MKGMQRMSEILECHLKMVYSDSLIGAVSYISRFCRREEMRWTKRSSTFVAVYLTSSERPRETKNETRAEGFRGFNLLVNLFVL